MATTIVPPAAAADPSMADLRAMLGYTTEPAAEPAPKPVTPEPAAGDPPAVTPEPAAGTGDKTPTPVEEPVEEPLPEGVQKRIAKEAEKAARIQSEIDRAVSERKAKEAELQKLQTTDGKGSEPVNQPKTSASEKPKKPTIGEVGHESETWEQFQARESAYEDARDKWLKAEALTEFQQQTAQSQAQAKAKEDWNAAVKEHGADFPAKVEAVRAVAQEGLQIAIGQLDNWSGVAVHLAKNPTQLAELAKSFEQNPTKAIATLGRIEAALAPKETKPATAAEPLPEPIKKVGGSASASGQDFQTTVENGSMSQLRALVKKARESK